jgi:hypothetical protein
MAGTAASVVAETYAGRTVEGNRIYNVSAVMTATVAAENITTITLTRLREIIGTPGLAMGKNDDGTLRYVTVLAVSGNVITATLNADLTNTKILHFYGQVVGR